MVKNRGRHFKISPLLASLVASEKLFKLSEPQFKTKFLLVRVIENKDGPNPYEVHTNGIVNHPIIWGPVVAYFNNTHFILTMLLYFKQIRLFQELALPQMTWLDKRSMINMWWIYVHAHANITYRNIKPMSSCNN